jgi:hypothetical protein
MALTGPSVIQNLGSASGAGCPCSRATVTQHPTIMTDLKVVVSNPYRAWVLRLDVLNIRNYLG